MKHCIIVYGNIASGKTTLCQQLLSILPGYKPLNIDNYREQLDWRRELNKFEKENLAQAFYLRDLKLFDNAILETTACSRLWYETWNYFELESVARIIIHVKCPISVCLTRYDMRHVDRLLSRSPIPMPPRARDDPQEGMKYIAHNQHELVPHLTLDSSVMTTSDMMNAIIAAKLI